jgi:hypothetical protein
MKFKWWAIRLTDDDGTHTYGLETSLFQLPDIFPTRKAARESIRAWGGGVEQFHPHPVRVTITVDDSEEGR